MRLFDLVFLLCAAATLLTAARLLILLLAARYARAIELTLRWALCASLYFTVLIASSLLWPRTVLAPGEPRCFDDWCIATDGATQTHSGNRTVYTVQLRLSSRARRVAQRERNLDIYLTDTRGHRYNALSAPDDTPLDVLLAPASTVTLTRHFVVPSSAQELSLVVRHKGGFPVRWFIIGEESWFHPPTLLRLA